MIFACIASGLSLAGILYCGLVTCRRLRVSILDVLVVASTVPCSATELTAKARHGDNIVYDSHRVVSPARSGLKTRTNTGRVTVTRAVYPHHRAPVQRFNVQCVCALGACCRIGQDVPVLGHVGEERGGVSGGRAAAESYALHG